MQTLQLAGHGDYLTSLSWLSMVMQYYQGKPSFDLPDLPGLEGVVETLNMILMPLPSDMPEMTSVHLAGQSLPAAMYKITIMLPAFEEVTTPLPLPGPAIYQIKCPFSDIIMPEKRTILCPDSVRF